MYERLGYCALRAFLYRLADAGEGVVMVHDLHDEGQLRRVRSPLLKHLLGWRSGAQPA